jgi:polyisoprenoid-binding protein YceI
MPAPSGQLAPPALQSLLTSGHLAGAWVVDPSASSVRLTSKVMGLIPVNGRFGEITGGGTVGPDGQVRGTLVMAAASIDTGNKRRDTHLRSADFFDSDHHRDITFTADGIRLRESGAAVTGALTVRGQTRPLSLPAVVSVHGDGDGEIGLDASVRINRADFGITWNALGLTSMSATVTVHAVFIRE